MDYSAHTPAHTPAQNFFWKDAKADLWRSWVELATQKLVSDYGEMGGRS